MEILAAAIVMSVLVGMLSFITINIMFPMGTRSKK